MGDVEDEEPGLEDEDDEPINPLVDALFDEIETLRMQVRLALLLLLLLLLQPSTVFSKTEYDCD